MVVEHDTERHRFVVHFPEGGGELVYRRITPRTLDLVHTGVEPALRRRGIGDALVRSALAYAREQKLRIVPTCPFVARWLEKHPEERELVTTRADAGSSQGE